MKIHDAYEIYDYVDGQFVIRTEQVIDRDFWQSLDKAKEEFDLTQGDWHQLALIPTAVINRWTREGFDIDTAKPQEILDKLRKDEMDKFIISGNKRF